MAQPTTAKGVSRQQQIADYDAFTEKFKLKKTTDDCYTPPEVFAVVVDWACERFAIDPDTIVRPFYPGGDFEAFDYPDGCTVLDNPPFSILARIKQFYVERGIPFFLFAPTLTIFCGKHGDKHNNVIAAAEIVYENGAHINTSFVTSYGDNVLETAPDLHDELERVSHEVANRGKATIPKYVYPDGLLTAARAGYLASHGTRLEIKRGEAVKVPTLDSQRAHGKSIFGGGLLLSERAAAERAAAERAAAERAAAERAAAKVWELSDREREIQKMLGARHD